MKRTIIILISGIFLITGCISSAPNVTLTPVFTPAPARFPLYTPTASLILSPTVTPPFTSISQPSLTKREWKPSPILVTYDKDRSGFCSTVCPPDPVPFILYGDGNFFLYTSVDVAGSKYFRYLHKKLDQSETCRILNTLDQTGFLDFDPSTYSIPRIDDAANWRIEIRVWKNKEVTLYGLGEMAYNLNYDPGLVPARMIDPPSVRDAFALLYNYPAEELDVYVPELLGIWIWKSSFDFSSAKAWTVDGISLSGLYKKAGSAVDRMPRPIYLAGEDAKDIYMMLDNFTYYGEVIQNDEHYGVYIRPVLPFEIISGDAAVISPNESQMKLPSSLHCSPSDGTMPIPTFGFK